MKKPKVSESEKKEYTTTNRPTDYNIPKFGYRSSFCMLFVFLAVVFFVPWVMKQIFSDYRLPTVIVSALLAGYSVSFLQYFFEKKQGFCKGFVIVGLSLSIVMGIILFLFYFGKVML